MFFGKNQSAEAVLFFSSELTLYDLALFCKQSYEKIPQPEIGEWLFLSKSVPNGQGYYGLAYVHRTKPCVVIAHRGTDTNLMSNLLSDASIAFSKLPKAQHYAKAFSEEVRSTVSQEYRIIETGHSLGGFHAEMNVALLNTGYALTFESPGIGEMCDTLNFHPNPDQFLSFFSIPNVINTAKPHIGNLYQICAYRIDNKGLLVTPGSYLMPLTQALLKSKTPVDSAANAGLSVVTTTVSEITKRQFLHHSLDGLIAAMHPGIGYPWLMRRMTSWPGLKDFLRTQATTSAVASVPEASVQICGLSDELPGYLAGDFICAPNLGNKLSIVTRSYRINALKRFDVFFHDDIKLREVFIHHMGLTPEEITIATSTTHQPQSLSPQLAVQSLSSKSRLPESPPKQITSPSSQPAKTSEISKPAEKVIVANSVLSKGLLIEETSWRISLVKSPGKEHAFLLLEGIKEGAAMHLRCDFFMDTDSRAEIAAKIPTAINSSINALSGGGIEDYIGRGFVRTKELTPQEYEKELGRCKYQSWPITQDQAEIVSERLIKEAKKPVGTYSYSIAPGNKPSRFVSGSSIQIHNCVTWCQDILQTVGIKVGSHWALAEYPSQVVRKAIQENAAQPQKPPSSPYATTTFLSNSSGYSQQSSARVPGSNARGWNTSLPSLFAQQEQQSISAKGK